MSEIDTTNKFMVAVQADNVVVLRPLPKVFTPDDAMLLAAYLVALAEHKASHPFQAVLDAVCNT